MDSIILCTYDPKLLPERKTAGAVCWDMKLAQPITMAPQTVTKAGCGFKTRIPHGWHAAFYARSGLPSNYGLMLANSVAIIDADYRGEYIMQIYNFTANEKSFEMYDRLTQLTFVPTYMPDQPAYGTAEIPALEIIVDPEIYATFETLYPSVRGEGRFTSTGLH